MQECCSSRRTRNAYDVVAATNDITEDQLRDLRKICVDEVKRNSGKYKFDDAVRFQKG